MSDIYLENLCRELEHFETPEWAARSILHHEVLTAESIGLCAGSGILCKAAVDAGYAKPFAIDIYDWGYPLDRVVNVLSDFRDDLTGKTVFMNPPFSKAEKFVEIALMLGARKILCFQRFAWWESAGRRDWWSNHLPNRIYICGDRASCWRHDIPLDKRGSGTPTAHAWFVWEKGHPPGTIMGRIYKVKTP